MYERLRHIPAFRLLALTGAMMMLSACSIIEAKTQSNRAKDLEASTKLADYMEQIFEIDNIFIQSDFPAEFLSEEIAGNYYQLTAGPLSFGPTIGPEVSEQLEALYYQMNIYSPKFYQNLTESTGSWNIVLADNMVLMTNNRNKANQQALYMTDSDSKSLNFFLDTNNSPPNLTAEEIVHKTIPEVVYHFAKNYDPSLDIKQGMENINQRYDLQPYFNDADYFNNPLNGFSCASGNKGFVNCESRISAANELTEITTLLLKGDGKLLQQLHSDSTDPYTRALSEKVELVIRGFEVFTDGEMNNTFFESLEQDNTNPWNRPPLPKVAK